MGSASYYAVAGAAAEHGKVLVDILCIYDEHTNKVPRHNGGG